jgi:hypothetical protein
MPASESDGDACLTIVEAHHFALLGTAGWHGSETPARSECVDMAPMHVWKENANPFG